MLMCWYSDPLSGFRKQAIFMFNEIILGTATIGIQPEVSADSLAASSPSTDSSNQSSSSSSGGSGSVGSSFLSEWQVNNILDEYLSPALWNLRTTNTFEAGTVLSVAQLTDNIITLSLLCEGVGNLAVALGERFDHHLIITLYPLTEKLV